MSEMKLGGVDGLRGSTVIATWHICSKIYNFVFPIQLYLCHMERDGGRSTGVLLAASE
jgi:hypothetical protein